MNIKDLQTSLNGKITENAPLGAQSWFRCGGSADLLFKPADAEDLVHFLKNWPDEQPITIIGGLANTIIRDGGIRGACVQLGKEFGLVKTMDDRYIEASCGALNGSIAAAAVKAGLGGMEFLSGIPGTLGGALRMNAGAYGAEMNDILIGATALDRRGNYHRLTLDDMHMSYRHCGAHHDLMFLSAVLKGKAEDYKTVKARITEIKAKRNETQPIKDKTGGSTFANPSVQELKRAGLPEGTRAWQVVEKVGGRDLKIGGAAMSEKHGNFMINTGDAKARDLEMLGDEIRRRAREDLGLELKWEIKRIGEA
jgi:UDP-N-acetylmuramate dehydrogenase